MYFSYPATCRNRRLTSEHCWKSVCGFANDAVLAASVFFCGAAAAEVDAEVDVPGGGGGGGTSCAATGDMIVDGPEAAAVTLYDDDDDDGPGAPGDADDDDDAAAAAGPGIADKTCFKLGAGMPPLMGEM